MKISYNIAENKKIDVLKFSLVSLILIMISVILIVTGVVSWSTTALRFKTDKAQLRAYEVEIEQKKTEGINFDKNIKNIKARWNKKIAFSNTLVKGKLFPYLDQLGKLELLLPGGAYITRISLSPQKGSKIVFTMAAISQQKLMEAYSKFLRNYNLKINSEAPKDGVYYANCEIELKLKNKK
jgi:hypothetical protein